jgi:hypothetical protein
LSVYARTQEVDGADIVQHLENVADVRPSPRSPAIPARDA